jgi:SOS-response transcriptional repressor LexA
MSGLSPEMIKVYNFIKEFIKKNKYAPTYREITQGTGLTGDYYTRKLIKAGYIKKSSERRSLRPMEVTSNDKTFERKREADDIIIVKEI